MVSDIGEVKHIRDERREGGGGGRVVCEFCSVVVEELATVPALGHRSDQTGTDRTPWTGAAVEVSGDIVGVRVVRVFDDVIAWLRLSVVMEGVRVFGETARGRA